MNIELDRIYNMDCLEGMKAIPDGSVDAVICDLPYGVLNRSNPDAQWDSVIPLDKLWEQYKRICKPTAVVVLFGQGMFTADLMQSNRKWWRYNIVWDKVRTTGFLNANRMPLRCHEDIVVFYDQLPTYNPQMEKCPPHLRNHSRGPRKDDHTNRCYGTFKDAEPFMADEKYPRSILTHPNIVQSNWHPTQKPVDLLRYLVLTYTNEGDTVLDNCMGSGTTAIACIKERRHFIGFELNKEYFDKACKRIDNEQRQLTLF